MRTSRIRNAVLIANIRLDTQKFKKKCMLSEKKLEKDKYSLLSHILEI